MERPCNCGIDFLSLESKAFVGKTVVPTQRALRGDADAAIVIHTVDQSALKLILNDNVQAVIFTPPALPPWFGEVALAVEAGDLKITRTVLPGASYHDLERTLDARLSAPVLSTEVRECLKRDIMGLADELGAICGVSHFMLRFFTEAPTDECGFHVDTVPPAAPTCGILRVYNGRGTDYADPANVTCMRDFYTYLARRERLIRERKAARHSAHVGAAIDLAIDALDKERAFLMRPADIKMAPAGAIVAFKHVDIRQHWSDHAKSQAWIHASPMSGKPRLVVNLTAPGRPRSSPRPATRETSH